MAHLESFSISDFNSLPTICQKIFPAIHFRERTRRSTVGTRLIALLKSRNAAFTNCLSDQGWLLSCSSIVLTAFFFLISSFLLPHLITQRVCCQKYFEMQKSTTDAFQHFFFLIHQFEKKKKSLVLGVHRIPGAVVVISYMADEL